MWTRFFLFQALGRLVKFKNKLFWLITAFVGSLKNIKIWARAVVVPKHRWLEWLTNGHDFDYYPHPAKNTFQTRFGLLVRWEEQKTLENIPTLGSPLPEHWDNWLANPVANHAVEDSRAESEEVEVVEDLASVAVPTDVLPSENSLPNIWLLRKKRELSFCQCQHVSVYFRFWRIMHEGSK